jgi:hypothetical protein
MTRKGYFTSEVPLEDLRRNAIDNDSSLRWAAAIQLGKIKTEESAEILWNLTTDSDDLVKEAAQHSLNAFHPSLIEKVIGEATLSKISPLQDDEVDPRTGLNFYREWKIKPLPIPESDNTWAVETGLLDIIATEGPLTGARIYSLYGRASYPNTPSKLSRSAIKNALSSLTRKKAIEHNGSGYLADDFNRLTFYKFDSPPTVLRTLGPRRYSEVPLDEVKALIEQELGPFQKNNDKKFQVVMDAYGISKSELHIISGLLEKEWAGLFG